ncbi:MAG TPA: GAF domain-containing protein [Vicinamibacteria bacterium]
MDSARRDRAFCALGHAAEALSRASDLDTLLVEVLEAARAAVPSADKGAILFWDEVFQTLHVSHTVGYADPRAVKTTFPSSRGYAARCARERRPLVIGDAREDLEIRYDGEIDELRAIQSAVLAPLLAGGRLLGVISLDALRRNAFDEGDTAVLVILAGLSALAVDNFRLQRDLDRRVQERTEALSSANVELGTSLAERDKLVDSLTEALTRVKTLSGLLPICASCKKVRDDTGYWSQIEAYIRTRTEAEFTHGICPDCARRLYPEHAAKLHLDD